MKPEKYILSVPYGGQRLDFAGRLAGISDVQVSRRGLQRRVQISLEPTRISELREHLPKEVRIEPVITHMLLEAG